MKKMKQMVTMALVLIFALVLAVPAFAAGPSTGAAPETKGSITINNATAGATYNAYRILDLQSYDNSADRYAYVVNQKWAPFFASDPTAQKYVKVDSENGGTIKWIGEKATANIQEFGKAARTWATAQVPMIEPDYHATTVGGTAANGNNQAVDGVAKFENLELGYYLVFAQDTGAEAAISLDTTNANIVMREKNEAPVIGKVVDKDTSSLSKTLKYTIPVVIGGEDLESYTITDTMTGIKINESTIAVKSYEKPGTAVDLKNFTTAGLTEKGNWRANLEYTVKVAPYVNADTSYVMSITLNASGLKQLKPGDIVVVTYDAEATRLVVDKNEVKLDYTNDPTGQGTPPVIVETKNFAFNLKKTNEQKEIVQGAEFKLYEDQNGQPASESIKFAKNGNSYKVATTDDTTTTDIIEAGEVKIQGLGAGKYYLEEIKAPAGYNKLLKNVTIQIDSKGAVSIDWNGDGQFNNAAQSNGDYTVEVINKAGIELPSTGGIGTTVFYVVGGLLMLAAVVALIVKKRMKN